MTLPVLTAISDPSVEAALVAAFGSESLGVAVSRRCVDLADLLATAAAGTGRAVLVSADLRGLDQGAVAGLQRAGLAVVGLAPRAMSRSSDGCSRSVWTRFCPRTPRQGG